MIEVTTINIIAVLFVFYAYRIRCRKFFLFALFLLICFYGIRFNYGNDYMAYEDYFLKINADPFFDLKRDVGEVEIGWQILCKLFQFLGFPAMVFFLTIIQFGSIFYVLDKYIDKKDQFVVLFFYLFSCNLMLTCLSMMRQCFAMSLILFSIPLLLKRKYLFIILIIIFSAQFHSSAYIMLLLPLSLFLFKLSKKTYKISILVIFLIVFVLQSFIKMYFLSFIELYFDNYSHYNDTMQVTKVNSGFGVFFNIIFMFLFVYIDNHEKSLQSWFLKIKSISYLFIPLSLIIPLIDRVGTYPALIGIYGIPTLYRYSKKNRYLTVLFIIFIFITLYDYFGFFNNSIWEKHYMVYHTIFTY